MNIFIYGDSNTWGYIPNINGYSKDAIPQRYPLEQIWWYNLSKKHSVVVNGLCGRTINSDDPWITGRNATKTFDQDFNDIENTDLCIIQLGTNDCKSRFALSPEEICFQMENFIQQIRSKTNAKLLLISPPFIKRGTPITDKYYVGAEEKSQKLDIGYKVLSKRLNLSFASALNLEVGEDGEHLTKASHSLLGQAVEKEIEKLLAKKKESKML